MAVRWGPFRGKSKKMFCSFCGKDSEAVKCLIAGPAVFICDECIGICNKILLGNDPTPTLPKWDDYTDERLLSLLERSSENATKATEFLESHVDALRKRNVAWADIGKSLGTSRQAAWERFS